MALAFWAAPALGDGSIGAHPDGELLEQAEFAPASTPPGGNTVEAPSPKAWARALSWYERSYKPRYQMLRIKYASDGLEVVGYIFRLRRMPAGPAPVIIFNRGGNREFSRVDLLTAQLLEPFIKSGYVVLASQYRGNDGGQGREEFGGADIADVFNLRAVADRLDYVDHSRVFVLGVSRGAMMTLLALERGFDARAAVVIGAPVDLLHEKNGKPDPRMIPVYRALIPEFDDHPETALRARSPIYDAHRIRTPLLILQGTADVTVDPEQARRLAARLAGAGTRDVKLVLVPGGDHTLDTRAGLRDQAILDWFDGH